MQQCTNVQSLRSFCHHPANTSQCVQEILLINLWSVPTRFQWEAKLSPLCQVPLSAVSTLPEESCTLRQAASNTGGAINQIFHLHEVCVCNIYRQPCDALSVVPVPSTLFKQKGLPYTRGTTSPVHLKLPLCHNLNCWTSGHGQRHNCQAPHNKSSQITNKKEAGKHTLLCFVFFLVSLIICFGLSYEKGGLVAKNCYPKTT